MGRCNLMSCRAFASWLTGSMINYNKAFCRLASATVIHLAANAANIPEKGPSGVELFISGKTRERSV